MKNFDLVVFDMVGTTVADRGEAPRAFMSALSEFHIDLAPQDLSAVRGASKREALATLLGPSRTGQVDAVYERFVETLSAAYRDDGAAEIPGATETFLRFKERGFKIALNTGFERSIVELLLSALRWPRSMFDAVVCGDETAHGRPAPDLIFKAMAQAGVHDPCRIINVGDTALDMEAGARAGAGANVAVLSGAHSREKLSASAMTHIVNSVAELPGLVADG